MKRHILQIALSLCVLLSLGLLAAAMAVTLRWGGATDHILILILLSLTLLILLWYPPTGGSQSRTAHSV